MKKDEVFQLAKEIFLKRMPSGYLNDKNQQHYESTAKDAVEVAKMFVKIYEENK